MDILLGLLDLTMFVIGVSTVGRYFMEGPYEEITWCPACGDWLWKSNDPALEDFDSERRRANARCQCGDWIKCSHCNFTHHPQEKFCHATGKNILVDTYNETTLMQQPTLPS
ncbi:MAG: hypothetical protein Q7S32_03295 [bacterium]|nr:hypothetical protein [bacterium]